MKKSNEELKALPVKIGTGSGRKRKKKVTYEQAVTYDPGVRFEE